MYNIYSADTLEDFSSENGNTMTDVIKAVQNCISKALYASYLADVCHFCIPLVFI